MDSIILTTKLCWTKGVAAMSQFTKKALIESFIKLLNQTTLDKITVKDIVDDCGVTRNTFYYYFQDIYALLEEIFQLEAQKVIEANKDYDSWQDSFLQTVKFALENKRIIFHSYHSLNRDQLERYLHGISDSFIYGFVKKRAEGMNVTSEDIKFISDFYKFALVGMLLEWIRNGMADDPHIFMHKMEQLFEGNIHNILVNAELRK